MSRSSVVVVFGSWQSRRGGGATLARAVRHPAMARLPMPALRLFRQADDLRAYIRWWLAGPIIRPLLADAIEPNTIPEDV
jgi:hypothetical protein